MASDLQIYYGIWSVIDYIYLLFLSILLIYQFGKAIVL